jgi:hypothetical protein
MKMSRYKCKYYCAVMLTVGHIPSFMMSFLSMALFALLLVDLDAAQSGQYKRPNCMYITLDATYTPRHPCLQWWTN